MDEEIQSPILTIPSISHRMGSMIIAKIGDFNRFDSAEKTLAYTGMSPSIYQLGSWITVIPTWRIEVPDTCTMFFTMPQHMFANGMIALVHILKRSV